MDHAGADRAKEEASPTAPQQQSWATESGRQAGRERRPRGEDPEEPSSWARGQALQSFRGGRGGRGVSPGSTRPCPGPTRVHTQVPAPLVRHYPHQQPQDKEAPRPKGTQCFSACSPRLPPVPLRAFFRHAITSPKCGESGIRELQPHGQRAAPGATRCSQELLRPCCTCAWYPWHVWELRHPLSQLFPNVVWGSGTA